MSPLNSVQARVGVKACARTDLSRAGFSEYKLSRTSALSKTLKRSSFYINACQVLDDETGNMRLFIEIARLGLKQGTGFFFSAVKMKT